MPTFHDPLSDAAEASEALRGLAHASRVFHDPADTYRVFGELVSGVRSLRQILDQLAHTHLDARDRAFTDDGNPVAGAEAALAAADELHQAGTLLDQASDRLDEAFTHAGKIAWHPEPAADRVAFSERLAARLGGTGAVPQRWVSVVFLQGDEADAVLDLIDRDGPDAAIDHLKAWDYGDETTDAALENGYVYDDQPPASGTDRTVSADGYTVTYNPALGHVGLYRQLDIPPDPALLTDPPIAARTRTGPSPRVPMPGHEDREVRGAARSADRDWFASPSGGHPNLGRGLSL